MHFRILKMIATSGFLECTKFVIGGLRYSEVYSAPADPLAGLTGDSTFKGKRSGGEVRKGEGRGDATNTNSWIRP